MNPNDTAFQSAMLKGVVGNLRVAEATLNHLRLGADGRASVEIENICSAVQAALLAAGVRPEQIEAEG